MFSSPRREGLEFGIVLQHVIEFGYKSPHRGRAENTKRFCLASRSRSSILRIQLQRKTVWQTETFSQDLVIKTLSIETLSSIHNSH